MFHLLIQKYAVIDVPYVKRRLITVYDGINNTGNSHSDNSNIWKDLMGDKDISISNKNVTGALPTWSSGNGLNFGKGDLDNDGKDYGNNYGFLEIDYDISKIDNLSNFNGMTIYTTYWFDGDDGYNNKTCDNYVWTFNDGTTNYNDFDKNILAGGQVNTLAGVKIKHKVNNTVEFRTSSFDTSHKYAWAIVVTKNASNKLDINVYRNDKGSTSAVAYSKNQENKLENIKKLFLGGGTGTNKMCKGYNTYIYNFMVYNEALTSDEIKRNFEIDENRYQLLVPMDKSGGASYGLDKTDDNITYIP